jgi:hypothetical protein
VPSPGFRFPAPREAAQQKGLSIREELNQLHALDEEIWNLVKRLERKKREGRDLRRQLKLPPIDNDE